MNPSFWVMTPFKGHGVSRYWALAKNPAVHGRLALHGKNILKVWCAPPNCLASYFPKRPSEAHLTFFQSFLTCPVRTWKYLLGALPKNGCQKGKPIFLLVRSAGNEKPNDSTNHPLRFPQRESLGSMGHSLLSTKSSNGRFALNH